MTKVAAKKIIVTHPTSGVERKFDAAIYEPIKAAILKSLKGSNGKTFSELTKDVIKTIKQIPKEKKKAPKIEHKLIIG